MQSLVIVIFILGMLWFIVNYPHQMKIFLFVLLWIVIFILGFMLITNHASK